MNVKKAGFSTKLIILILLLAVSLALLSVRSQLQTAQEELNNLEDQVRSQSEINAGLRADIDSSGDDQKIADIAREKLNLVEPGERVFAAAGK